MGKKSAPKVEKSASEQALAEVSLAKHNRYKDLYVPHEKGFVEESRRDMSNTLTARNTADVAQASSGVWKDSGGSAVRTTDGFLRASGDHVYEDDAMSTAVSAGRKTGQALKDAAGVNAMKIGHGKAADAQSGLAAAARAANTEAVGKAKARQIKNDAYAGAVGSMAGAATAYALDKKGKKPKYTPGGNYPVPFGSGGL